MTAAAIISEIGDISRFPNADALAAYAGISPMRYSTGQTNIKMMRDKTEYREPVIPMK